MEVIIIFVNFDLMDQVKELSTYERKLTSKEKAELATYFNSVTSIEEIMDHISPNNVSASGEAIRRILSPDPNPTYAKQFVALIVGKLIEEARTL